MLWVVLYIQMFMTLSAVHSVRVGPRPPRAGGGETEVEVYSGAGRILAAGARGLLRRDEMAAS